MYFIESFKVGSFSRVLCRVFDSIRVGIRADNNIELELVSAFFWVDVVEVVLVFKIRATNCPLEASSLVMCSLPYVFFLFLRLCKC